MKKTIFNQNLSKTGNKILEKIKNKLENQSFLFFQENSLRSKVEQRS